MKTNFVCMKEKVKSYCRNFAYGEEGSQIVEYIAVLAVVALMIGILAKIGVEMKKTGTNTQKNITDAFGEIEKIK